jgi:hypothetical protein
MTLLIIFMRVIMYNNKTRVNFINSVCKKSHNLLSLKNKMSQAVSVRWSLENKKKKKNILWVNYMHFYGKSQTREKKNVVELLTGLLKIAPTLIYFVMRQ